MTDQHPKSRPIIARTDLVHGMYYEGHCRNAKVARWNGERGAFIHWRTKFGSTFLEGIKHPDDEQHFDVFLPFRQLDEAEVADPVPFIDATGRGVR
jgi:hypothetical protein